MSLGIKNVTERLYRGYPRDMDEIQQNLDILRDKKEQVLFYIRDFPMLSGNDKKQMTKYLEEFYVTINNKKVCKMLFIDNARRE